MKIVSDFSSRLKEFMSANQLSYGQLGRILNMKPQTLNRYILKQREPKANTLASIADLLNVSPLWLQGYDVPSSVLTNNGSVSSDIHQFTLTIADDSMSGADIHIGDKVTFTPTTDIKDGQLVVCILGDSTPCLRRFRISGSFILLQAENATYPPVIIPATAKDITQHVIGVAIQLTRELT